MTKVLVNSQGKPYIVESNKVLLGNTFGTKTITENGTYTASSDNLDGYSSVTVNVSGGDVTLTRISDDNDNEIGTYYMNFQDDNGNMFKVVLLDAQYRLAYAQQCSSLTAVTDMPMYSDLKNSNIWEAYESATENTQLILDYCAANGYTSTACSHCRSKSFTIDGVTYYGQLPNVLEVLNIARNYNSFDAMDTSASSQSSLNFSSSHVIWSSNQYNANYGWYLTNTGTMSGQFNNKSNTYFTCPVLEIPL